MPNRIYRHITALAFGIAIAGTAIAQEGGDGPSFSWSVTGATDYIWRGVSQTDNDPSIFIAGSVNWGDFYAGAGAEYVDFGNSINTEYDLWAGWAKDLGPVTLDLGVVRYGYLDQPSGADLDTVEVKAALSKSFGAVSTALAVYYTDDYFGNGEGATYVEASGGYTINEKWSLSGSVGHQDIEAASDSYVNWQAGVNYAPAENVTLSVFYHDTDAHAWGPVFDSGVTAAITVAM